MLGEVVTRGENGDGWEGWKMTGKATNQPPKANSAFHPSGVDK